MTYLDTKDEVWGLVNEAPAHKYFTLIPNIVDDLDLSLIAFRLLVHIMRVTGDGQPCTQGQRTLAASCRMSITSVIEAKRELVEKRLVFIRRGDKAKNQSDAIAVRNLWEENARRYANTGSVPDPYLDQGDPDMDQTKNIYINPRARENPNAPTREQVLAFAPNVNLTPEQAEQFFLHYEAREWVISGNPIRNWQSQMKLWHLRESEFTPAARNGRRKDDEPDASATFDHYR